MPRKPLDSKHSCLAANLFGRAIGRERSGSALRQPRRVRCRCVKQEVEQWQVATQRAAQPVRLHRVEPAERGQALQRVLADPRPRAHLERQGEQEAAAVTFTETLARDFPGAVPTNQFVSGTQNALARHGILHGGALPMIATCRDELAFALTAELQRAWGGAFNMAGLAGLLRWVNNTVPRISAMSPTSSTPTRADRAAAPGSSIPPTFTAAPSSATITQARPSSQRMATDVIDSPAQADRANTQP